MKWDALIEAFAGHPWFDLATLAQLSGDARADLRVQLHRWVRANKLVPLRRGVYTLADRYRRASVNPAKLANELYRPSYLSGLWALGFYGLIPEKVVTYTSVTPRVPRRFENAFGNFEYRHVKQSAFLGYRVARIQGAAVFLAEPEKALLDLWHLERGPWTRDRMAGMRFQNTDAVRKARLKRYAAVFGSPRLLKAAEVWCRLVEEEQEGTVEL